MATTVTQALGILFGAFGKADDKVRLEIYAKTLKSIPPALVEKAVYKTLTEWTEMGLPPIGVILQNAASLNASVQPGARVPTWEEAWREINSKMQSTPWGKQPTWSAPQIKAAVDAFGWSALQGISSADFNTARAQVRRFYEDACSRISEQAHNDFLLGKNPQGVLGIPAAVAGVAAQLEVRR